MYQRKSNSWVKHYDFIIWDLICLQASFMLVDCVVIFLNSTFKNVLKRDYYCDDACFDKWRISK